MSAYVIVESGLRVSMVMVTERLLCHGLRAAPRRSTARSHY
jgi:hypothetical protein